MPQSTRNQVIKGKWEARNQISHSSCFLVAFDLGSYNDTRRKALLGRAAFGGLPAQADQLSAPESSMLKDSELS